MTIGSSNTYPATDAKIRLIFAWDLVRVQLLLVRDHNLDPSEAMRRIDEYRKYMAINAAFPDAHHPISKEIDEVWHCHVLDTPDHARFCDNVFGKFVHHNPVFTAAGQEWLAKNYAAHTLPHLKLLFGEPSQEYWLNVRLICWGEGGGGNCSETTTRGRDTLGTSLFSSHMLRHKLFKVKEKNSTC